MMGLAIYFLRASLLVLIPLDENRKLGYASGLFLYAEK